MITLAVKYDKERIVSALHRGAKLLRERRVGSFKDHEDQECAAVLEWLASRIDDVSAISEFVGRLIANK